MIEVVDPTGAARDPGMPSLALALDPGQAERALKRLPGLARDQARLRAIRVTRHKPGRRCLVEYDLEVERAGSASELVTVIGKVRAGRYGMGGYRLLTAFREAGFVEDSPDGIAVPEPAGTLSKFHMWLQRKVAGTGATELLPAPEGVTLARRIAEAAYKVHAAGVRAERRHSMAHELQILHRCLQTVAIGEPRWVSRLASILRACEALARAAPESAPCGIHRDFYGDQVVVAGPRLYLIDFDLYCAGERALDIGNFLGHVTEQSLRRGGDPGALGVVERALEDRYVELTSEELRPRIRCYAALTLVRHIYLSTLFPERRPLTLSLIDLCEDRLGVLSPV